MRMPSGVVDQYIYFVAVDSTDLKTRETGLSSFTVYRARNGGSATAYTTPTIAEVSSSNMPGVYSLLLDEDMTIDSGDHSQEMVLHITQASMAPVTRVIELYRPDVTAGTTLGVSSGNAQISATDIRSAVGLASANLDTQIDALPTANENADGLLDRSSGVEAGLTPRQALRLIASVLFSKASGLGTSTAVFRNFGDSKDRVTATVDANGNRSAITTDAT